MLAQRQVKEHIAAPYYSQTRRILYAWLDDLFKEINPTYIITLKAIASCSDDGGISHATIDSLLATRKKLTSMGPAKGHEISYRTFKRHIKWLDDNIPEFKKDTSKAFKNGKIYNYNTYYFNVEEIKLKHGNLESQRGDTVAPLSIYHSKIINYHTIHIEDGFDDFQNKEEVLQADADYLAWESELRTKEAMGPRKEVDLTHEQSIRWKKLKTMGVYFGMLVIWLKMYDLWKIDSAIEKVTEMMAKGQLKNPGAYIATMLKNFDKKYEAVNDHGKAKPKDHFSQVGKKVTIAQRPEIKREPTLEELGLDASKGAALMNRFRKHMSKKR